MSEHPFEIARDPDSVPMEERTLQDFRNELLEQSFVELRKAQMGGSTYPSNLINGLISKLDWFYGTESQITKTEIKAYEAAKGREGE